jgi:hypothetical protein
MNANELEPCELERLVKTKTYTLLMYISHHFYLC